MAGRPVAPNWSIEKRKDKPEKVPLSTLLKPGSPLKKLLQSMSTVATMSVHPDQSPEALTYAFVQFMKNSEMGYMFLARLIGNRFRETGDLVVIKTVFMQDPDFLQCGEGATACASLSAAAMHKERAAAAKVTKKQSKKQRRKQMRAEKDKAEPSPSALQIGSGYRHYRQLVFEPNHELEVLKKIQHQNVVKLRYMFAANRGTRPSDITYNLVFEYVPGSLDTLIRHYAKRVQRIPALYVKLFTYQVFRGLAFCHSKGIWHRDIRPKHLLINPETNVLKLTGFSTSLDFALGAKNNCHYGYYTAPEILFGAMPCGQPADIWSAGCVLAECLIGIQPLFQGPTPADHLVDIMRVIGTPTDEDLLALHPHFPVHEKMSPYPWEKVFPPKTPAEAVDLVSKIIMFHPNSRLAAIDTCVHKYFDELRDSSTRQGSGRPLPPLFNFTEHELQIKPDLYEKLVPPHEREKEEVEVEKLVPPHEREQKEVEVEKLVPPHEREERKVQVETLGHSTEETVNS